MPWCGLDFTLDSLAKVDSLLADARNETDSDNRLLATMAMLFGCYVGQVLIRYAGGRWVRDETLTMGSPLVIQIALRDDEMTASPTARCVKRLRNGEEDSVECWCRALVAWSREAMKADVDDHQQDC
jgi:hypothetical protein